MYGKGNHPGIPAEGFGHHAGGKGLELLAFVHPLLGGVGAAVEEVVEIGCLSADDAFGVPIRGLFAFLQQPAFGVALLHQRPIFQTFAAKLAAAVVPVGANGHPVAFVQSTDVDAMTVVPHGIAVVIRHRIRRGIVVTVNIFDHTVGIVELYYNVGSSEELFHLKAFQIHAGQIAGIGEGLIDIADQNAAGMPPDMAFHFFGLPNSFAEFVAA